MSLKHEFLGQQEWPTNVVMPAASQTGAEIVVGGIVAIGLILGLKNLIRHGDRRLLICLVGGFICCVLELHTMYMLKFFYPQVGQHVFMTGFGRPIPWFLAFTYSAFFGLANYFYINTRNVRSFSASAFWLGVAAVLVAEAVMEILAIQLGVWAYFDDQPFVILEFPIHTAVIVSGMCIVLGSVSRIWFDRVRGANQYWMLLLYPVILIATFNVFVYPFSIGVSSDSGLMGARIGSAVSIVLTLGLSYFCASWSSKVPDLHPVPSKTRLPAAASKRGAGFSLAEKL